MTGTITLTTSLDVHKRFLRGIYTDAPALAGIGALIMGIVLGRCIRLYDARSTASQGRAARVVKAFLDNGHPMVVSLYPNSGFISVEWTNDVRTGIFYFYQTDPLDLIVSKFAAIGF